MNTAAGTRVSKPPVKELVVTHRHRHPPHHHHRFTSSYVSQYGSYRQSPSPALLPLSVPLSVCPPLMQQESPELPVTQSKRPVRLSPWRKLSATYFAPLTFTWLLSATGHCACPGIFFLAFFFFDYFFLVVERQTVDT